MSSDEYEGLGMKQKGKHRPSSIVRLSAAEMAEVGYGDVGRFPAADIYAAPAMPVARPAGQAANGDKAGS